MPWFFPWSDFIKKRACRYLLQHYLGHFLQEKLTLDQLTVDLYNGTGRVDKVPIDVWSVNEMLDNAGIPLEMIDGFIGSISVSVPWTALLSESCCMDIQGLEVTIAPRQRVDTGGSMTDSMVWNAMTTSMQLAQECLKEDPSTGEEQADASAPFEGLESFAQTIESVLARVKLSFTDTVIRFEHLPKDTKTGIGLEIHIKRIDYSDLSTELAERDSHYKAKSVYEPAACACKKLKIFGVSVHLDEFPEQSRTVPQVSDYPESPPPSPGSGSCSPPLHHPHSTLEGLSLSAEQFHPPPLSGSLLPQIKVATFAGHSEVKLKLKQNVAVPGPKVDVECFLGTLNIFLSPKQIHLLTEFSTGFSSPDLSSQTAEKGHSINKPMKPEDYQKIEQELQNQLMSTKLQEQRHQQAQQRVNSWNFNFDSCATNDALPHYSSGNDYDSILGDGGEETFYSMSSNHDALPPLEEPVLPADMLMLNRTPSGNLLQSPDFSPLGTLGVLQSSPYKLMNTIASDKRFVNQKIQIPGTSLTEAAGSMFVSAKQSVLSVNEVKTDGPSRHRLSSTNPGLAGIAAIDDPCPDVTKVTVKLTSLAATLLHIDPVLAPTSGGKGCPYDDSAHPLACMADKFFSNLGTYGFGGKDFDEMSEKFVSACTADHLRCMAAPVSFEFEKTVSSSHQTGKSELSVGKLELSECLFERSTTSASNPTPYATTELLKFQSRESPAAPFYGFTPTSTLPCIKLKYKSTKRTTSPSGVQSRNVVLPKSELSLELGSLLCELDVSIVDRLTALLDPQPIFVNQPSNVQSRMFRSCNPSLVNQQAVFTQAMEDAPIVEQPFVIHVTCPSLTVVLRFPIPDLRPAVDRRPWWKQSLRKEHLTFEFSAVECNTSLGASEQPCKYNFSFKEMHGHFQEDTSSTCVPVIDVTHGQSESDTGNGGFDWPRIVVTVQPPAPLSTLEEVQSSDNSPLSSIDAYPVMKAEPSPFSSRPVMFETEELLMPGSQEEMTRFQEDTVSSSKVHVECTFPKLDVNLHTKDVFENIYNRLASDLLLWEPMAPSPTDRPDLCGINIGTGLDLATQMLQAQGPDRFVMCRSGLRFDDDASSSEDDSSNLTSLGNKYKRTNSIPNGQTTFTLTLNISKARLAIFPISESSSTNSNPKEYISCPDQVLGEVAAEFNDVVFFIAACYKSQVDLSYLCLQSQKVSFQHAPLVPQRAHASMESAFSGAELQSTLYHTEPGMRHVNGRTSEPMFAFAIKVSSDTTKNIKEILFSLGLRRCTLRHRMLSSKQMWLTQVTDFFDVKDDPVLGFSPPAVITVFHTHVWEGAVDYRPIHLPLRVLVTMETFNVSSNLTIESNVSLLRFIIDDAALYLSDKCSGSANIRNYVCVLDLGLFELSLFTCDSSEQGHPRIELRMSNNIVNVRTCSDSCSALLQLIQYIAADGDLVPSYEAEPPNTAKTPSTPSRCPAEPPVKQGSMDEGALSTIMTEAMVEETNSDKGSRGELSHQLSTSPRRDLFLFPDDEMASALEDFSPETENNSNSPIGNLGQEEEEYSDDDFCILEHPDIEPEDLSHEVVIKSLTDEQVNVVENHFTIPIGPSDQLSAPSHFPPAVFSYTLKEMSVVWHLYGGQDFGATPSRDEKKTISFAVDEKGRPVESFSVRPTVLNPHKATCTSSKKLSQKSGGPNRNNHVLMEFYLNKIRLQYEGYPEDSEQVSRLVLLVQDVEIRDRLAHSQINKFLYQYTSEACPKQTHANMILLKMLYVCPDAGLKAQECNLRVSIQPLRLNVDQDALFFLRNFFSEIMGEAAKNPKGSSSVDSSPVKAAPTSDWLAKPSDAEETLVNSACGSEGDNPEPAPTFFRSFIFSPEVPIRLDYQGKRVDMEQGTLAGLLIGLAQLNCSELRLKRLCCRSGLLGVDRVVNYALSEWLADIKGTQLPGILGGVGPVHSFLQLFQGLVDLVWLPIDQYRRDGRVMRGLQRGANSFTTSSAMAFLELTNRVVQIIQAAAETAYDVVSPDSPVKRGQNRLAQQPADLREGVTNAYQVFREGLGQTATNIVQVAKDEHEQKGVTGAVGGVLRQVPATVVQPLILATEATSNVLGGVRNQILPDARREAAEKWRASP